MRLSCGSVLGFFAPLALLLPSPALAAPAPKYEQPPSFNAAQLPGIRRIGVNYTIENPVRSDGILRVYVLKTPYGEFTVHGDQMLHMRLNEFAALAALEKVSNSDSFGKALADAGLSPLKFTGRLITNPIGTVHDTFAGVGAFFGRIGSGINNAGQTPDNAMAGLLGISDERRKIAAAYGVDPYTDLPPLSAKLDQLSQAAAAGGLVVTGALLAVPGAAGIVVSNLSTVNKVNDIGIQDLARDYTAAQILDINRALLAKMGVDEELSKRLLANRYYTPIDMAAMVAAIDSLHGVEGREVFFERAAAANSRALAYFMRRHAELLADDYRIHHGYVRFVSLASYPFVITTDGRVMTLLPIDALSWTQETAAGFAAVTAARKQAAPKDHGQLRIDGMVTHLAQRELKREGWSVEEHR
jgi:hypothetical protein